MRTLTSADWAGFAAFVVLIIWYARRGASTENAFLVADRSVGLFPLVATLVMTEFNTSTLFAFSAAGYTAGPMALALPLVFLIGLGFYTVTVAREWKRFDRLSVAELFATRYSRGMGRFASLLLLTAMTGFCATYVKSLGLIFAPSAAGISFPVLTAVLTLIVLAVVLPRGLTSVVRTDVVSFLATLLLLPTLLIIGVNLSRPAGGIGATFPPDQMTVAPIAQWNHPALPFWFVSSLIVLTCFTYIAAPWYGQKIFAARNERTAFVAVAISAAVVFLLYGTAVMAAAHLRVTTGDLSDAQLAIPFMTLHWLPPVFRGVGVAVLFAAALTTLAGVWTAMAAMVAADFAWDGARHVSTQRVILSAFALLSWLGAVTLVDNILNRLILANIPVAGLAFALLAGFHWPRATTAAAWTSAAVGILWGIGSFVIIGEAGGYTWTWAMYGVPLIFATGIVVSLLKPAA